MFRCTSPSSRSLNFSILPLVVRGMLETQNTCRGTRLFANVFRTLSRIWPADIVDAVLVEGIVVRKSALKSLS